MAKEIDPKFTKRQMAFDLWMKAPIPMVTIFKTLNVSNLVKLSHKHAYKFNMLLCYCIGKAAVQVEEFFLLPVADKLIQNWGCFLTAPSILIHSSSSYIASLPHK